jgi:hypothetical protein
MNQGRRCGHIPDSVQTAESITTPPSVKRRREWRLSSAIAHRPPGMQVSFRSCILPLLRTSRENVHQG